MEEGRTTDSRRARHQRASQKSRQCFVGSWGVLEGETLHCELRRGFLLTPIGSRSSFSFRASFRAGPRTFLTLGFFIAQEILDLSISRIKIRPAPAAVRRVASNLSSLMHFGPLVTGSNAPVAPRRSVNSRHCFGGPSSGVEFFCSDSFWTSNHRFVCLGHSSTVHP